MRSVFSGTESLGTKSGSTEEISSGGAFCAPTEGISFEIVELVFVMCGLSGFEDWILRCSAVPSWAWAFPGPARRRDVVDIGRANAIEDLADRSASLMEDMAVILILDHAVEVVNNRLIY